MTLHSLSYDLKGCGLQNNFVVKHISNVNNNSNNNNNENENNAKIVQQNHARAPLSPILPKQIWLFFGGNAQLALDWHDLIISHMEKLQEIQAGTGKSKEKDDSANSWMKPNEVEYLVRMLIYLYSVFCNNTNTYKSCYIIDGIDGIGGWMYFGERGSLFSNLSFIS